MFHISVHICVLIKKCKNSHVWGPYYEEGGTGGKVSHSCIHSIRDRDTAAMDMVLKICSRREPLGSQNNC